VPRRPPHNPPIFPPPSRAHSQAAPNAPQLSDADLQELIEENRQLRTLLESYVDRLAVEQVDSLRRQYDEIRGLAATNGVALEPLALPGDGAERIAAQAAALAATVTGAGAVATRAPAAKAPVAPAKKKAAASAPSKPAVDSHLGASPHPPATNPAAAAAAAKPASSSSKAAAAVPTNAKVVAPTSQPTKRSKQPDAPAQPAPQQQPVVVAAPAAPAPAAAATATPAAAHAAAEEVAVEVEHWIDNRGRAGTVDPDRLAPQLTAAEKVRLRRGGIYVCICFCIALAPSPALNQQREITTPPNNTTDRHPAQAARAAREAAQRAEANSLVASHSAAEVAAAHPGWLVFTVPEAPVAGAECVLYYNKGRSPTLRWVFWPCLLIDRPLVVGFGTGTHRY
jgi:hypothetical protein